VFVSASGVSPAEAHEYLERLGLRAGAVVDPTVSMWGRDAFHGVHEARADWAVKRLELNGKFALRESTEVFGQAMTVTAVIGSDGLLTTDDRGGTRVEVYRRFPVATCYRGQEGADCNEVSSFDAAWDDHGTIVEFVRDREGFPSGVRFGESLALRYDFTPPLPEPPGLAGDRWREPSSWELIDLRSSEIVVDSVDAARLASERPRLSVGFKGIGAVLRVEGGELFAAAQGRLGWPYALIPLESPSEIWRIVYASGDMSEKYRYRVDYTGDLLRVEVEAGEYGENIVVEAPRSRASAVPVSIVHPGADMLTEALRSRSRLRTAEPAGNWLESSFDKESLPIVLRPFDSRGLEIEKGGETGLGVSRATARVEQGPGAIGIAHEFEFGPAEGCEVESDRVLCKGGASEVIGEESPDPW
jgi:CYTH domain-containing protein